MTVANAAGWVLIIAAIGGQIGLLLKIWFDGRNTRKQMSQQCEKIDAIHDATVEPPLSPPTIVGNWGDEPKGKP